MTSLRKWIIAASIVIQSAAALSVMGQENTPGYRTGTVTIRDAGAPPTPEPVTPGSVQGGQLTFNNAQPGISTITFELAPNKVKATFMGVSVVPAGATLRSQLKLPYGTGLTVTQVEQDGAAKDLLREHDVLYKFADQLLINSAQFAALVRMHKPGDSIDLTVIREAKEVKVAVKLIEREIVDNDGENDYQRAQQLYGTITQSGKGTLQLAAPPTVTPAPPPAPVSP